MMSTQASPAAGTNLPDAARRLIARLAADPAVRRIVLFGSRARGDAQPRSDVDLAVEAPDASPLDWQRLLDKVEEADTLLSVDLVRVEDAADELRERIRAEGVTLHER
jgi:predicted nucleotidyltransferase